MNAATYFAPRPMTAFERDNRIIQAIGYSRFNEQYLPGTIHGPIPHPHAILDLPEPYPFPDNRPHSSIVFGNDPGRLRRAAPLRRLIWWLDLQSLFNLRQMNREMREFISKSEVYKDINKALHLYKEILFTKYAQSVLVIDFFDLLTTMHFGICGEFAMLISIPECWRLCQSCVETGQRRGFGLDPRTRVSRFVPWNIFAQSLAPDAATRRRYWDEDFSVGLKGWRRDVVEYSKVEHLYMGEPHSWRDLAEFNYLVTCAVPYMDPRTRETESGIACKGCIRMLPNRPTREDKIERVYSREEFLRHFQMCHRAQLLWQAYNQQGASIPIDTTNFAVIQGAINFVERSQRNCWIFPGYLSMG